MSHGRWIRSFAWRMIAYVVVVFAFAVVWHVILFEDLYRGLGYFQREHPGYVLGFISIATQGALLSAVYPAFVHRRDGTRIATFAFAAFVYLWSSHVMGDAAKFSIDPVGTYVPIETFYLALQFTFYGLLLHALERRREPAGAASAA